MSPRRPTTTPQLPPGDLDRSSPVPLYRQLAELLREGITSDLYPPGAQLPTEPALISHFDVTRPTVRAAFADLQAQGLVLTARGRGTFVREAEVMVRLGGPYRKTGQFPGRTATSVEIEKAGREMTVRYLAVDQVAANHDVAQRLAVHPGSPVARRHRVLMADRIPLQIATSYVPWNIAKNTPIASSACEPEGSYPHLEQAGHPIHWLDEEISARMPTPEEKSLLRLAPGTPVIRLVRTARDPEGRPVEVADTINAADRYVLKYPFPYKPVNPDLPDPPKTLH